MYKIKFKNYFVLMVFMLSGFLSSLLAQNTKQPNILFLNIDDLKPMLGCYGDQEIISPNIDKLAEQGVTFSNAYCQQAVCAPSRISLFTGLRPDRTKVWDLKTYMRDENPDVITLPQFFKQNGYQTVGYGKLFHGARKGDPQSWSIPYKEDKYLTYADGYSYPANGKYQNELTKKIFKESKKHQLNWKETNLFLKEHNASPSVECLNVPDDAYSDGAITVKALKQLEEFSKKNKPFFLALGFHKPHLPFVAPKKYWDLYQRDEITLAPYQEKAENAPEYAYHTWGELRNYSDIPQKGPVPENKQRELIHGYKACVSFIDAQIGTVMNKLEELGLSDNTIIILWGDHGWHLGDHGLWCKHSNFEQATKVPMIISAPGYQVNKKARTMAEFVDVYPTLVDLAGLPVGKQLEGKSLIPALQDHETIVKDYAISQYPRGKNVMGYSIRTNRYRLTLWLKGAFYDKEIVTSPNIAAAELYDYKADPLEKKSLAEDPEYTAIRKQLENKLLSLLKEQL
ncbi:sulfatase [Labilibacter sediminis]|nr:sulfatase [Labilibacter sediminis]